MPVERAILLATNIAPRRNRVPCILRLCLCVGCSRLFVSLLAPHHQPPTASPTVSAPLRERFLMEHGRENSAAGFQWDPEQEEAEWQRVLMEARTQNTFLRPVHVSSSSHGIREPGRHTCVLCEAIRTVLLRYWCARLRMVLQP